jgi:hypothetical protein
MKLGIAAPPWQKAEAPNGESAPRARSSPLPTETSDDQVRAGASRMVASSFSPSMSRFGTRRPIRFGSHHARRPGGLRRAAGLRRRGPLPPAAARRLGPAALPRAAARPAGRGRDDSRGHDLTAPRGHGLLVAHGGELLRLRVGEPVRRPVEDKMDDELPLAA